MTSPNVQNSDLIASVVDVAEKVEGAPSYEEYDVYGMYDVKTLTRRFGGWSEVLKKANISSDGRSNSISNEELLDDILRVKRKISKTPTVSEYSVHGEYSHATVKNNFESWNTAMEKAGLEPNTQNSKVPKKEILDDIFELSKIIEKTPTQREYNKHGEYSVTTVRERFGTWNDAVRQCGLQPHNNGGKIRQDKLLNDIKLAARSLDKTPTIEEYDEKGEYHHDTIIKRFNTWDNAVEAAGLKPNNKYSHYTKDEAIDDIQCVANKLGESPSCNQYREHGKWSPETIREKFGSWPDAVREAGLEPKGKGGYSVQNGDNQTPGEYIPDTKLLNDLQDVIDELGYPPTKKEYTTEGKFSGVTLSKRFGGWDGAMSEIGVDYNIGSVHPDKIIADIQSVAEQIGHQPSGKEYNNYGNHTRQTARNKFGSWNDALKAAGFDPVYQVQDETILADLMDVANELGHPPSREEYDERGGYSSRTIKKRFEGNWTILATEAYELSKGSGIL